MLQSLTRRLVASAIALGLCAALPVSGPALRAQARRVSEPTSSARPDENRFTVVTLIPYGELDEGIALSIAKDGRVFVIERRLGNLKVYDPQSSRTTLVAT